MSAFKSIDGDTGGAVSKVEFKMLRCSRKYFKWAVVRLLEWFANGVTADEDMGARLESLWDVCSACLSPAVWRLESLEGALETIDVKCGI